MLGIGAAPAWSMAISMARPFASRYAGHGTFLPTVSITDHQDGLPRPSQLNAAGSSARLNS
jgi:hypothetical protein